MYDAAKCRIDDRIVILSMPRARPIVRRKADYKTEFGAKVSISDDNGFVDVDRIGWDIRRNLAKINYRIHTDAIQTHLIPPELGKAQTSLVYASEADVLNMALFGQTANQWRLENSDAKGNIRDQATGAQLVCLSNLENLNALFLLIGQALSQSERLTRLNQIAIGQMKLLTADERTQRITDGRNGI